MNYKTKALFLSMVLLCLLAIVLSACNTTTAYQTFAFKSSSKDNPSPDGYWVIQVNKLGKLMISQVLDGKVLEYGEYQLNADQNDQFWQLIESAKFEKLALEERSGTENEREYTFSLTAGDKTQTYTIWSREVANNAALLALVGHIKSVIVENTGLNVTF